MENSSNPHSTTQPLSFFEIFQPQHNSQKLLIPRNFVTNLTNKVKFSTVLLQGSNGNFWNVKLEKIGTCLAMTNGWNRYVNDHGLKHGELLLFRYIEDYVFHVQVFGLDYFLKQKTTTVFAPRRTYNRNCDSDSRRKKPKETINISSDDSDEHVKVEEDEDVVADSTEANEAKSMRKTLKFFKIFGNHWNDHIKVPVKVVHECNIQPPEDTILRTEEGDASYKVTFQKMENRVVVGNAGLRYFWNMINLLPGDKYAFEFVTGRQRKVEEIIFIKNFSKKHDQT